MSSALERMEAYGRDLQDRLVAALEALDGSGRFERKTWQREEGRGGGGRMAILRGSRIEKAGVHWSSVRGDSNPLTGKPFHATGVSVIIHCANPHAPTAHMNVRYFEETPDAGGEGAGAEGQWWYGGGMDLTPMGFPYEEDTRHFHGVCRAACEAGGGDYGRFREWADEYFHVKHHGRPRGVGGIFFDQWTQGGRTGAFDLVQATGDRFLEAYRPILERRLDQPYTVDEKDRQLHARGVYVEFNLAYDRGTRFGFESGGNVEAILSSLPPVVKW